jgi:hypothetical protein
VRAKRGIKWLGARALGDAIGSGAPRSTSTGLRLHLFIPLTPRLLHSSNTPAAGCSFLDTATRAFPRAHTALTPFIPIYRVRRLRSHTIAMALSKSTRIMILLAIDTGFFFLELIVGYAVHSLALVADSFHMVCAFRFHMSQTMTNGKLS